MASHFLPECVSQTSPLRNIGTTTKYSEQIYVKQFPSRDCHSIHSLFKSNVLQCYAAEVGRHLEHGPHSGVQIVPQLKKENSFGIIQIILNPGGRILVDFVVVFFVTKQKQLEQNVWRQVTLILYDNDFLI